MEYNLNEKIKENLESLGYKSFTEIQKQVIPVALEGNDIVGKSRTGTGKTAAFLIPIIQKIEIGKGFQALILAPTRELAIQIKEESDKISKNLGIFTCPIYGGERIENQINYLRSKKPEIIVGTPGRVIDHMRRKNLTFSNIKFFVLDEVDEMVNRGFIEDIEMIGEKVKESSSHAIQTLLFSATISKDTEKILDKFLRENRILINNTKNEESKIKIDQYYMPIDDRASRIESLIDTIYLQNPDLAIIFASTKRLVDKISDELINQGFPVEKIHSDLSQKQRTDVYNKLKNRKIRFLIATDIAARGIDVEGVSHVYNYDCPQDLQFYVHRIGRTGRAGSRGESLIILKRWERNQIFQMEKLTGGKINPIYKPSKDQVEEIVKQQTFEKVKKEIEKSKNEKLNPSMEIILKNYKPEEMIIALFNTFNVKREEIKNIEDEGFRRKPKFERKFSSWNDRNKDERKNRNFRTKRRQFNY